MSLKKHLNRKGAKNAKALGFAGMGGFIAQLAKKCVIGVFPFAIWVSAE